MKQVKCEMCGSTDMVKQNGFFVCQSCGVKYSVEEAKKMLSDNVVQVEGTVKVDQSDEITSWYILAERADDDEIKLDYYHKILEKDANSWKAWFHTALIENKLLETLFPILQSLPSKIYTEDSSLYEVINYIASVLFDPESDCEEFVYYCDGGSPFFRDNTYANPLYTEGCQYKPIKHFVFCIEYLIRIADYVDSKSEYGIDKTNTYVYKLMETYVRPVFSSPYSIILNYLRVDYVDMTDKLTREFADIYDDTFDCIQIKTFQSTTLFHEKIVDYFLRQAIRINAKLQNVEKDYVPITTYSKEEQIEKLKEWLDVLNNEFYYMPSKIDTARKYDFDIEREINESIAKRKKEYSKLYELFVNSMKVFMPEFKYPNLLELYPIENYIDVIPEDNTSNIIVYVLKPNEKRKSRSQSKNGEMSTRTFLEMGIVTMLFVGMLLFIIMGHEVWGIFLPAIFGTTVFVIETQRGDSFSVEESRSRLKYILFICICCVLLTIWSIIVK